MEQASSRVPRLDSPADAMSRIESVSRTSFLAHLVWTPLGAAYSAWTGSIYVAIFFRRPECSGSKYLVLCDSKDAIRVHAAGLRCDADKYLWTDVRMTNLDRVRRWI